VALHGVAYLRALSPKVVPFDICIAFNSILNWQVLFDFADRQTLLWIKHGTEYTRRI